MLRGPSVGPVNTRRAGMVAWATCVVILLGVGVGLVFGAVRQNGQLTDLRQRGVTVNMTVTGCTVQMGGTGTAAASYVCRGTYVLDGHRVVGAVVPGSGPRATGSVVRVVAPAHAQGPLTTPAALRAATLGWRALALPLSVLVSGLAAGGAFLAVVVRRRPPRPS